MTMTADPKDPHGLLGDSSRRLATRAELAASTGVSKRRVKRAVRRVRAPYVVVAGVARYDERAALVAIALLEKAEPPPRRARAAAAPGRGHAPRPVEVHITRRKAR